jgi:hypothetical protein
MNACSNFTPAMAVGIKAVEPRLFFNPIGFDGIGIRVT